MRKGGRRTLIFISIGSKFCRLRGQIVTTCLNGPLASISHLPREECRFCRQQLLLPVKSCSQ